MNQKNHISGQELARQFGTFLPHTISHCPDMIQLIITREGRVDILMPNTKGHQTRKSMYELGRLARGVKGRVAYMFDIENDEQGKQVITLLQTLRQNKSLA